MITAAIARSMTTGTFVIAAKDPGRLASMDKHLQVLGILAWSIAVLMVGAMYIFFVWGH